MPMESAHRPLPGLRQIVADSGGLYVANAAIGFNFAASGPVAIILAVGAQGGLSEADLSSWIFGAFSRRRSMCPSVIASRSARLSPSSSLWPTCPSSTSVRRSGG